MRFSLFIIVVTFSSNILANEPIWVGESLNGLPCKGRDPNYGPFDYTRRSEFPQGLHMVEHAHFTKEVENLISGSTGALEPDLDYTLIAWPNHHRALLSVIHYQTKVKIKLIENNLRNSPECYLQRAIHFSPEDSVVYSLYGYYLHKMGYLDKAVKYFEKALELSPDNPKISYSFSLLLVDLKRYDEAAKYAKISYEKGKPPPGLKKKLEKLGVWTK